MKVLIDTNVIIDYLADRSPFADDAFRVLSLCESGRVTGVVTANAITDIYYVVRKVAGRDKTLEAIRTLCAILDIVDVGRGDVLSAIDLSMPDYEDALAAQCAKRSRRTTSSHAMSTTTSAHLFPRWNRAHCRCG